MPSLGRKVHILGGECKTCADIANANADSFDAIGHLHLRLGACGLPPTRAGGRCVAYEAQRVLQAVLRQGENSEGTRADRVEGWLSTCMKEGFMLHLE